jgi:hypothetical protein
MLAAKSQHRFPTVLVLCERSRCKNPRSAHMPSWIRTKRKPEDQTRVVDLGRARRARESVEDIATVHFKTKFGRYSSLDRAHAELISHNSAVVVRTLSPTAEQPAQTTVSARIRLISHSSRSPTHQMKGLGFMRHPIPTVSDHKPGLVDTLCSRDVKPAVPLHSFSKSSSH